MKSRKKREGVELEMWVNSQCAELLMMLPTGDAREAAVEWLRRRVVNRPDGAQVPQPPDPRQQELPGTADLQPGLPWGSNGKADDFFGEPS